MEASIPFQDGLSLGCSLDVTKYPFKPGPLLVPEDIKTNDFPVNLTTPQFCVTNTIDDVCTILQLPLAYALKVEANLIVDDVVTSCLRGVGDQNTVSAIFRISFLQQKQYLPQSTKLDLDALCACDGDQPQAVSTDAIKDQPPSTLADSTKEQQSSTVVDSTNDQPSSTSADGTTDQPQATSSDATEDHPLADSEITTEPEPGKNVASATHWVKALEVGNELIVICRISSSERDDVDSAFRKLTENLGAYRGLLESKQMYGLEEFAKKMDKKLKKKQYSHMDLSIEYCSHLGLQLCPGNLSDMILSLEILMRSHCISSCITFFIEVDCGEGDSIEVIASESDCVHYVRAIIQTFESEDLEAYDMIQNPRTHENKLRRLHKFLLCNMQAIENLQKFLASEYFISETHEEEGKKMLKSLYVTQVQIVDTIKELDFITVPTEEKLQPLLDSNSEQLVQKYIEKVTSELPPGPDLDLLIIGKTGHGKSSTGNSILGEPKFEASASGESVTTSCGVGWTRIDGRTIKVVDTPGVCDTRVDSGQSSTDVAIQGISEAIAHCPEGFHALLLVIRFGQRMTTEEKRAIGMLKCILGEDIIRTHCICVVTHGDNFQVEIKGQKTFKAWCKDQSGFLKEIFEECQYRCVLFDNKNESLEVLKRQVIELVAYVDKLSICGTRYTNSLFEFAMNERKRTIETKKAPEADERITRDIQLVLGHLDKMIKGSDTGKTFESDLENLKYTVDNLKNDVNSMEGSNMENLVETVFALAQAVHEKIDNATVESPPQGASVDVGSNCDSTFKAETQKESPSSPHDETNSGSKSSVCKSEKLKTNLKTMQGNLQEAQQTIDVKRQEVNQEVARHVEEKVKEEKNCFPGASWVMTKDGSQRPMLDLKIGDEILARNTEGQLVYERIYMFGHCDRSNMADFLVFETKHQRVVVSHDHLVYCSKNGFEVCLPARRVKEGDELITFSSNGLVRLPVLHVSHENNKVFMRLSPTVAP